MSQRFFKEKNVAAAYAKTRLKPPASLVRSILDYLRSGYDGPLKAAVDVGCGSGQCTHLLAPHFTSVVGVDISEGQIAEAVKLNENQAVAFRVSRAESLPFPDGSQQLVTSGQACHWFDLPVFFKEADRILVPGGVVALYCYDEERIVHHQLAKKLNGVIDELVDSIFAEIWKEGIYDVRGLYQEPKFNIPYPDFFRDKIHISERELTVEELTILISSWPGISIAEKDLVEFQEKFMLTLGVSTHPEHTPHPTA
ncbi:uncharacterized protein LOC135108328 [Scylla paramamosain]|uniref:uncharacterized protein LOC135108328 n=1 Tax=Scylla paramamosain TaxID=85552 RepID=UPI00308354A7